jgi:NAD(P)-dependent dehydrogenase (short-subunit alcohol dehydrogenase family)
MERRTLLLGVGAVVAGGPVQSALAADQGHGTSPRQPAERRKIAVISGLSSGIGYATALALADRGVDVIGSYRNNPAGAQELVAEASRRGSKVVPFHLDLNSMQSIAAFRDSVNGTLRSEFGADSFDYLVNNAGFGLGVPFMETREELIDEFYRVLVKGHYFMTQHLAPSMRDGGSIVNVTSNSALVSGMVPGYTAYASIKGAATVMTRLMAMELAPRLRVNGVAPGATRTRIANNAFERYPEVIPPIVNQTALKRLGEKEDIGPVIASVLSDDLGWVVGEILEASGGWNLVASC